MPPPSSSGGDLLELLLGRAGCRPRRCGRPSRPAGSSSRPRSDAAATGVRGGVRVPLFACRVPVTNQPMPTPASTATAATSATIRPASSQPGVRRAPPPPPPARHAGGRARRAGRAGGARPTGRRAARRRGAGSGRTATVGWGGVRPGTRPGGADRRPVARTGPAGRTSGYPGVRRAGIGRLDGGLTGRPIRAGVAGLTAGGRCPGSGRRPAADPRSSARSAGVPAADPDIPSPSSACLPRLLILARARAAHGLSVAAQRYQVQRTPPLVTRVAQADDVRPVSVSARVAAAHADSGEPAPARVGASVRADAGASRCRYGTMADHAHSRDRRCRIHRLGIHPASPRRRLSRAWRAPRSRC